MDPRDAFLERAKSGGIVPVVREVVTDADTPVAAFAKIARPPFAFLLESLVGGERWARYTFLGTEPREAWRYRGTQVDRWTPAAGWKSAGETQDPIGHLAHRMRALPAVPVPGLPRFTGGAVGYLGYDLVRTVERLPAPPADTLGVPDAIVMIADSLVILDNAFGRAIVVANVEVPAASSPAQRLRLYDVAQERLDTLIGRPRATPPPPPPSLGRGKRARAAAPARVAVSARGVRARRRQDPRLHRGRRCLPGRLVASPDRDRRGRSAAPVPLLARPESRAVSVPSGARRCDVRREFPRSAGTRRGRRSHRAADRGHAPARRDAGGRRRAGRVAARRREGACRAPHARGSRTQRRRSRGALRLRARHRVTRNRALFARPAPGERGARAAQSRTRRARRGPGLLPRRHRHRRSQGARDGDHRRARAGASRPIRRRGRLCRLGRGQSRHRDRDSRRARPQGPRRRASPRGDRRRLRSRARVRGTRSQGAGRAARARLGQSW